MKKSFMTRALATGLSFAMAFSLSAATNVTTASAAAKKASVTTFMKVASKSVTEGKKVTTYMNSTAAKKYRIKSHTESSVTKKYISVKMTDSRKGLTITANEGALAAVGLEKKGVYTKINFAPAKSASAVKKAAATKYVKLKVVVNAKPAEKLTMTAAATAVKEITLTFSNAVKDTAAAKIVVKKGNATPTFTAKWAEDAKSVVLAMDSKLTKGTYDVTVSGVEKEDLTASVAVEDQKLTAFELLSTNLVTDDLPATFGSIKFRGVDQYGKFMKTSNVTVTSSFGTLYAKTTDDKEAVNSRIDANSDPTVANFKFTSSTLAVIGTKGTITIVGENGVNLTSEITVVAPSQASKVESLGLYNTDKKKFMDMTAGDKIANYALALKFTDQYDTELTFDEANAMKISATIAGGTTGVNGVKTEDNEIVPVKETIDGKDVYTLPLVGSSSEVKAGTMQVTLVNTKYGLLDNLSFTVAPGTVIKSFSVSADKEIYNDADTELSYTAIDADGNEVTKYDVLDKAFKDTDGKRAGLAKGVELKKQADGSAKLVLKANSYSFTTNNTDYKESKADVLVFTLYTGSASTIVCNASIKVNEDRVLWEVTGIDAKHAIATTTSTDKLTFKIADLKIADQYGNTLTSDQNKNLVATSGALVYVGGETSNWTVSGLTDKTIDGKSYKEYASKDDELTVQEKSVTTIKDLELTFKSSVNTKDDGYKVTISHVDSYKASDFAIEWTDGTKTFNVSDGALDLSKTNDSGKAYFSVVGKVGGKKVTLPTDQYAIIAGGSQGQTKPEAGKDRITKTATLKVVVTDSDHKSNIIEAEYTYSNENSKLTKIESGDNKKFTSLDGVKISDLVASASAFKLVDQYGKQMTSAPNDLTATISIISGNGDTKYVKYDGTNQAIIQGDVTEAVVTLTCGDLTKTETITKNN